MRHGATHRGFVHADVDGDLSERQRPQVSETVLEKGRLPPNDALDHATDGVPAALQGGDQPTRGLEAVGQVASRSPFPPPPPPSAAG